MANYAAGDFFSAKSCESEESIFSSVFNHTVNPHFPDSFAAEKVADLIQLLYQTCNVLKNATKSFSFTLYMADSNTNEIYSTKKLRGQENRFKIEEGTTIAASAASRLLCVTSADITQDERFPQGIPRKGDPIKSVLCAPILATDGNCFAVIELYRLSKQEEFRQDDIKITVVLTGWMGVAIKQFQQKEALKKHHDLYEYLLDLTIKYFTDTLMLEKMISDVIKFGKKTLGAVHGTFFIVEKENKELVAEVFEEDMQGKNDDLVKKKIKTCFGKERAIAGIVAKTGVAINIKDAYKDIRFHKETDKHKFVTKAILCVPILGMNGVLGVIQMINKVDGGHFTSIDEHLLKTLSHYCTLLLDYTTLHVEMTKMMHINNVSLAMLRLQKEACTHDIEEFTVRPDVKIPAGFYQFTWYIEPNQTRVMPQYCLYMILQIVHSAEINIKSMMQFILSVRKLYRPNPYHNFEHAFNVCHCMHAILRRNLKKFTPIELKSLIIAALCHDLDHGGYTNNFLQLINDDLAQLYEESFLENHHYQITMAIWQDCEIYTNINEKTFKTISKEIKEAILATDLAMHFKIRIKLAQICNEHAFDWNNAVHRTYIKSIMMTSCDLSGNCKPFGVAKRLADNLYKEFYHQGDIEKKMGFPPISIMDREKKNTVPEDQIHFLNVVVIPCVELLRNVLPNTEDLCNAAIALRDNWQQIALSPSITIKDKKNVGNVGK